jgi:hypothetical protein
MPAIRRGAQELGTTTRETPQASIRYASSRYSEPIQLGRYQNFRKREFLLVPSGKTVVHRVLLID